MATIAQLEEGLQKAYNAGNMEYARILGAEIVRARKEPGANIPGTTYQDLGREPILAETVSGPTTLKGIGEAALTAGSAAVGVVPGAMAAYNAALGTGQETPEQAFQRVMQGMTYKPSQEGAATLQNVAQFMEEAKLPPVIAGPMGLVGMGQGASRAIAQQVPLIQVAGNAALARGAQVGRAAEQGIANIATKARESMSGGDALSQAAEQAFGKASAGSAQLPDVMRRMTTAESLPVSVSLTGGELTRNPDILAFERDQIKRQSGQALREQKERAHRDVLANFDAIADQTGSSVVSPSTAGDRVIRALSEGWDKEKAKTRAMYNQFYKSPEANNMVDVARPVMIQFGEDVFNGTLESWLNSHPYGVDSTKVIDSVKRSIAHLGLGEVDRSGEISLKKDTLTKSSNSPFSGVGADSYQQIPGMTVSDFAKIRREISEISPSNATERRQLAVMKNLIDAQIDPYAGPLLKQANAQRRMQAVKFENRAIVKDLLQTKRGSDDRRVYADEVFRNSILRASPDEITFLKRVLHTTGGEGPDAWKDLQAATIRHIQERATSRATGSADQAMFSSAKLGDAVKTLDANGRLDLVLGKQRAQTVRDVADVANWIETVPPGTLVNTSGTALTLISALGEAGAMGAATGLPLPVMSTLRALRSVAQEKAIKQKIDRTINFASELKKGQP